MDAVRYNLDNFCHFSSRFHFGSFIAGVYELGLVTSFAVLIFIFFFLLVLLNL